MQEPLQEETPIAAQATHQKLEMEVMPQEVAMQEEEYTDGKYVQEQLVVQHGVIGQRLAEQQQRHIIHLLPQKTVNSVAEQNEQIVAVGFILILLLSM